jgi:transcriptional regulator with XRE-family HTH domain
MLAWHNPYMVQKAHEKLKSWLKENHKTQTYLVDNLGVYAPSVSRWVNGKAVPIMTFRKQIETLTDGAVKASDWEDGQ